MNDQPLNLPQFQDCIGSKVQVRLSFWERLRVLLFGYVIEVSTNTFVDARVTGRAEGPSRAEVIKPPKTPPTPNRQWGALSSETAKAVLIRLRSLAVEQEQLSLVLVRLMREYFEVQNALSNNRAEISSLESSLRVKPSIPSPETLRVVTQPRETTALSDDDLSKIQAIVEQAKPTARPN
jgi:hypothetical protein